MSKDKQNSVNQGNGKHDRPLLGEEPTHDDGDGEPQAAPGAMPEDRDADFSALDAENSQAAPAEAEKDTLAELRERLDETHDKYLRALADLENYKKRALRERSDILKYQGEKVLYDLVEVVDDLERALAHVSGTNPEQFKAGIELIYKNFQAVLSKWGVRGESAIGQVFDPNKYNAISKVRVDDAAPGTVISELKKAYFYKDKLLRPGDVVVAEAGPSAAERGNGEQSDKDGSESEAG